MVDALVKVARLQRQPARLARPTEPRRDEHLSCDGVSIYDTLADRGAIHDTMAGARATVVILL